MRIPKWLLVGVAVIGLAVSMAAPASANFVFTGSGLSGNFIGQASEPWSVNFDWQFGGTQTNWGSPGVGAGTTPYLEAVPAFGLDLTFSGVGPIDAASIAIGNGAGCAGSTAGGTTFCTISPLNIWTAFQTGPDSISFRAQNASFFVTPGQSYFVNVFFLDDTIPTDFSFSGVWLTEFSPNPVVPAPAALPLFASGLGLMGLLGWRRKRKADAVAAI